MFLISRNQKESWKELFKPQQVFGLGTRTPFYIYEAGRAIDMVRRAHEQVNSSKGLVGGKLLDSTEP